MHAYAMLFALNCPEALKIVPALFTCYESNVHLFTDN